MAIGTLVLSILALAFTAWASVVVHSAQRQISDGITQARSGAGEGNLQLVASGVDAAWKGEKNLGIGLGLINLGLVSSAALCVTSLVFILITPKKDAESGSRE